MRTVRLTQLHARFESILSQIQRHARFAFRHLACGDTREDRVQETIGIAWKWFLSLANRGIDGTRFPTTLALRATQAVKAGRRLSGCASNRCVLSERTQALERVNVYSLPHHGGLRSPIWLEA